MSETKPTLASEYARLVRQQINGDAKHGWGVDDSMAVIIGVVDADFALAEKPEAFELSPTAKAMIRELVNPSAFRQVLEGMKALAPSKRKRGKAARLLAL